MRASVTGFVLAITCNLGCGPGGRTPSVCGNGVIELGEECDSGSITLSGDGCTPECTAELDVWRYLPGNGDYVPPDSQYALAYHSLRGVVVYHSASHSEPLTALWDGERWTRQQPWPPCVPSSPEGGSVCDYSGSGPPIRDNAMAFDEARGQIVMFGGRLGDAAVNSTFIWDGTWSQRGAVPAPSARWSHALAYDAQHEEVVLFGGIGPSGERLDDTWLWDGTSWRQATTAGPTKRAFHAMTYDRERRRVVLFGGNAGDLPLDDTWEWDGTTWTDRQPSTRPTPRQGHALGYHVDHRRTVLFGGFTSGVENLADTWEWDGTEWSLRNPWNAPPPMVDVDIAYDAIHSQLVLPKTMLYEFSSQPLHAPTGELWPRDKCGGADTDGDGASGCDDPDCWGRCDPLCPAGVSGDCDPDRPRCGDGSCSALETHSLCPGDCTTP